MFTCPKPNPQAKLRLFCFHHAGGGALSFRPWLNDLPSSVEVCLIELPGRGTRMKEALFTQFEPLIQALEKALLPSLNKPFVFFGHSMGAAVSFELARRLYQNYRLTPLHLYVSGHRAPQIPDPEPPIHNLPEPAFLNELRRYNGTPKEVLDNSELMELLVPILRADFAVLENYLYTPSAPLDCSITAFGGLQDWKVTRENLAAWQQQTNGAFSLQMFPGDHFFVYSSQSLLLQRLCKELHSYVSNLDV